MTDPWIQSGSAFLLLFCGSLACVYMLRKIRALHSNFRVLPRLDDLWILLIVSLIPSLFVSIPVVHTLLVTLLCAALLLLWLDAVLVYLYGFEINVHSIRIFLQGTEAFSGDSKELLRTFAKRSWFLATPVAIICLVAARIASQLDATVAAHAFVAAIAVLFLVGATKSRFQWLFLPIWLIVTAALTWLFLTIDSSLSDWSRWSASLTASIILVIVALRVLSSRFSSAFFKLRSPLRDFLRGARLTPDNDVVLNQSDVADHVELPLAPPAPSASFGLCRGANVILITMESLSRDYIQPFKPNGASLAFLNQLSQQALTSNAHYACCPNTNGAIHHIYQGNYPNNTQYPFLPLLKDEGYRTAYMMISRTRFFNLRDILDTAGFDTILDRDSEGLDPARGDYGFLDKVDALNDALGDGPFFLHLKNEQTHSPYQVVDKAQFNHHSGNSRDAQFSNAVEEADNVISQLIESLGQKRDLSNTIIVYTGDHGQSFGEFGYVSHSSASVNAQVRVPLAISHPALPAQTLNRSTHFDLMPTLLDLLGINCNTPIFGRSLLHGADQRPLLLYSQTRKGNAPSNASLLTTDNKIMVDLLYGYCYRLSTEDELLSELPDNEAAYYKTLLYAALEKRGLINDSIFIPRQRTGG